MNDIGMGSHLHFTPLAYELESGLRRGGGGEEGGGGGLGWLSRSSLL